ncbi:2Fe-2S iron-sulfur cluster-binding protein [Niveispirillum sp. KHB5.9]|uniref:2Fe-2S iron-sulfur cluster-binding protein n=1 Tax=Niveispirillum sp. KHB5.9 TaxID=3400269 RepID=UPI003A87B7CF
MNVTLQLVGEVRDIPVAPGQSLMQAIATQGRDAITALCGGCCICGTCRVRVLDGDPGPMGEGEAHLRRQLDITDPAIRLSCQMRPGSCLRVAVIHPR